MKKKKLKNKEGNMKKIFLLIVLVSFSLFSKETFLNLSAGMTLEEVTKVVGVKNIVLDKNDLYDVTKEVSTTNPFPKLSLLISKKYGLIRIIGFTAPKQTNIYGDKLKEEFSSFYDMLSKKYGEGTKFDNLKSGSIWNEPQDYMYSLVKGERDLECYWVPGYGATFNTPDLESIILKIVIIDKNNYFLGLKYELINFTKYAEELNKEKETQIDL